jgi:chaperonin GroES
MAKKGIGITPLGDRVVVKRLEAEQKTKGGIVLPDTAKEKPKQGEVVAVGAGKVLDSGETQEPQVKTGDRVIFSSFAGTEVSVGDEEYLIMSESDVLAVVE